MAVKVVRKKSLKGPDELITSTSNIFKFLSENMKAVFAVSAAVGVVFLSYIGWMAYKKNKGEKAGEALYAAMKVSQAKIDAAGTAPNTFKTEDDRTKASIDKFLQLSKQYKGSAVEEVGLMYAANAYYNLKDFDKAIDAYNSILFKAERREDSKLHGNLTEIKADPGILRDSALYSVASAYEQKGDLKNAIAAETSLTSEKDSYLREMGLAHLGRLYEKSKDKAKAVETYKKIIADYPQSPNISRIKEKLEKLKG